MKFRISWTSRFKKDYKLAMKRGLPIEKLDDVIRMLARGETLPASYRDHALTGNWKGHRECHIAPDWLLLYLAYEDALVLTLVRTGSHTDLLDP